MIQHLYSTFLQDERIYAQAEQFWIDLWKKIEPRTREGWRQPWFQPVPPSISEGNPIFSACSEQRKRGIRILQFEPTEKGLEFVAYPDTFGGSEIEPDAIHALVISCALSDAAAENALRLMTEWAEGKAICFDLHEAGLVAPIDLDSSGTQGLISSQQSQHRNPFEPRMKH